MSEPEIKSWYRMSIEQAYELSRIPKLEMMRGVFRGYEDDPKVLKSLYQDIAGLLSHAECVVADVEYNISG